MRDFIKIYAVFGIGMLITAPAARSADRIVTLEPPAQLRDGADALPTIANPADDAERAINAALRRLDAKARKLKCYDPKPNPDGWRRTVEVPMHGPGYLSIDITDVFECDGRPVQVGVTSIVYDLKTGAPVDWTKLLPPNLTGQVALKAGADGAKMVTLASKPLYDLYVAGYRTDDAPGGDDKRCHDSVAAAGAVAPPPAMVWPDAKADGLAVQFELDVPDNSACADAVVIPTATLRKAGANGPLLDAIDAAHRAL